MKKISILTSLVAFSNSALAVSILAPGDPTIGGARVDGSFEVGVEGLTAGVNNWPGAEPPSDIVDGLIGGGGQKYLNFAQTDTGVIITPAFGASIVTEIELWVANDAPERDPASFEIWGTNNTIVGGGPFDIAADFTQIASGALALPDDRDLTEDTSGFSQSVGFSNTDAYTSYLLLFPTVKGPAANSMQISEVQFEGRAPIPEPSSGLLALLGLGALARRRR